MRDYNPEALNSLLHYAKPANILKDMQDWIVNLGPSEEIEDKDTSSYTAAEAIKIAESLDELTTVPKYVLAKLMYGISYLINYLVAGIARQILDGMKHFQSKALPTDPSHTQLAKDPDDHPLHEIAALCGIEMVRNIGLHYSDLLQSNSSSEELENKADHFIIHPDKIPQKYLKHHYTHSLHPYYLIFDKIKEWCANNPEKLKKSMAYKGHFEDEQLEFEALMQKSSLSGKAVDQEVSTLMALARKNNEGNKVIRELREKFGK